MSGDEHLPEELNDCQQALESLVPRASRIDRDRLMIRLGQQSAARGQSGWKWATAASLLLATGLGLRMALVSPEAPSTQVAQQRESAEPPPAPEDAARQAMAEETPTEEAVPPAVQNIAAEGMWLLAVANGQYKPVGTLTVRPRPESAAVAGGGSPAGEVPPETAEGERAPMLRWDDRPLLRDASGRPTS